MNERIRELAEKAGMVRILEEHAHEYGNGTFKNTPYLELEKFAKLLLDEFIEALDKYNGHHSEMSEYGLSILIGYIRIHFGMEEKNGGYE